MGVLKFIKSIFSKRDAYEDGYEWAKSELKKRNPEYIEAHVYDSSDEFDKGACQALREHAEENE